MQLKFPELSLIALIGASGSGKSTFARRFFKPSEVVSSDFCRLLVSDDENSMDASADAFDVLYAIVAKRLKRGLLTVVDATNVRPEDRKRLVEIARQYHALPAAIILNLPERAIAERAKQRTDRRMNPRIALNHVGQLRKGLAHFKQEGFRKTYELRTAEEVDAITEVIRERLWNNRREERGPFDIIGDVHGCYDELVALLRALGWEVADGCIKGRDGDRRPEPIPEDESSGADDGLVVREDTNHGGDAALNGDRQAATPDDAEAAGGQPTLRHGQTGRNRRPDPAASAPRRLIFLGDLVDRGPDSPAVLRLVMDAVHRGIALCVPGNHDAKLLRWLQGRNVQLTHGLEKTVAQIEALPDAAAFREEVGRFLDSLVSHYVLDGGQLVVSHAGLKESMQGRASGAVREFCMYGETTGEVDEFGLPVRYPWANEYRGKAQVVYGHTPVPVVQWLNNTVNIDTGCVFGGRLSALRYPEGEIMSTPAAIVYHEPSRPFLPTGEQSDNEALPRQSAPNLQQDHDEIPDIADLSGRLVIDTPLLPNITIHEGNGRTALETISRYAVHPKWLIYLPPTMSPCETSPLPGFLEHPAEAFDYYRHAGVAQVICEEKHMGSRAVVIVCRDESVVQRRFGLEEATTIGVVYTRTGRRFFTNSDEERAFLHLLRDELDAAEAWRELNTDWIALDAELMPWSAKAQALLQDQYAAVGSASTHSTAGAVAALQQALDGGNTGVAKLLEEAMARHGAAEKFVQAYRQYCWPVQSVADYRLAPFHILATEGRTYADRDHRWHMDTLARWAGSGLLIATPYYIVDLADDEGIATATEWWEGLVARGREGMVVKPLDYIARTARGQLTQPAMKVRGPEYLRIIYGSDYDAPKNLKRLKKRGLQAKRSLALREFSLGQKALESFVCREPLRVWHQCVFGVLALESESVDPRL